MPGGWVLIQVCQTSYPPEKRWLAWATGYDRGKYLYRYGESPAAALRALAAQLREAQP